VVLEGIDDDVPGVRWVDRDQCLPDCEGRAGVCKPDLDNRLDPLRDQQISKQIAVPLWHRDRLEVPLVISCPRRTVLSKSAAYLANSCPGFVHLHPDSLDQLLCRAGRAPSALFRRAGLVDLDGPESLGEIEGIDLTLNFLRTKREEAERLSRRPVIQLSQPRARGDGG
jgi:hypothetical protein